MFLSFLTVIIKNGYLLWRDKVTSSYNSLGQGEPVEMVFKEETVLLYLSN